MGIREKKIKIETDAFIKDFSAGVSSSKLIEKYGLADKSQLVRLVRALQRNGSIASEHGAARKTNLGARSRLNDGGGPSPKEENKVAVDLDTGPALRCPGCGASIQRGWEKCKYCRVSLDFSLKGKTKICPHCFDKIPAESRFCMRCGRTVGDFGGEGTIIEDRLCPRCEIPMKTQKIGAFSALGCDRCDGLFVSVETFEMMQENNDRRIFPVDGVRKDAKWTNQISYVKCPVCAKTMARTNFGRTSGILVDICRDHGIWFDPG
jgi:hypothetical protein